jgi:hypothetical protein
MIGSTSRVESLNSPKSNWAKCFDLVGSEAMGQRMGCATLGGSCLVSSQTNYRDVDWMEEANSLCRIAVFHDGSFYRALIILFVGSMYQIRQLQWWIRNFNMQTSGGRFGVDRYITSPRSNAYASPGTTLRFTA